LIYGSSRRVLAGIDSSMLPTRSPEDPILHHVQRSQPMLCNQHAFVKSIAVSRLRVNKNVIEASHGEFGGGFFSTRL
jgi:hypothetical protein